MPPWSASLARWVVALPIWLAAAALGWWWQQQTPATVEGAGAANRAAASAAADTDAASPQELARRIAAVDPLNLDRGPLGPDGAPAPAVTEPPVLWRLSALVVRGSDRYALLTATGHKPMELRKGDKLPDGDRILSISDTHLVVRSARGRSRTLYLIDPQSTSDRAP
ncbi:MAG: hypothetical protein ABIN96_00025 [Rubrivivax sp.]